MPAVHPSSSRYFMQLLTDMQKRLTKLEHQQNTTIANQKGQPVLNFGLIPPIGAQTSAEYGLQMLNPGTGNVGTPVLQLGQQADGSYGLYIFGSNGVALMKLTDVGLTLDGSNAAPLIELTDTGMAVYNAGGTEELFLGEIPGGSNTYGLAVYSGGTPYMVNPLAVIYTETTTTLSNTTPVELSGLSPSSLSFTLGPSGTFAINIAATIACPGIASAAVGAQVYVQYQVNGGAAVNSRAAISQVSSGSSGTGTLMTVAANDHIVTTPNATVTATIWANATYLPSGTISIDGAFATFTVY